MMKTPPPLHHDSISFATPAARRGVARRCRSVRRGSVLVIVIWAIAIAALATAAVQLLSYRQSVVGREAMARVQARWAARAGIEETIAVMSYHTENPDPQDALAMVREMEAVSFGRTERGSWDIRHFSDGLEWAGPMDEHSKLNIATATPMQLLAIPNMTPDVIDAIRDWQDADDDVTGLGAERDYYLNAGYGYVPRNAPMRSIAELELVAGAWPQNVRGEDWNLNGRLDPNEDDGSLTWPRDNADGILDAGWSGFLTAYSRAPVLGASGIERIDLRSATPEELQARFGVDTAQAAALQTYFSRPNSQMAPLLVTDLGTLAQSAATPQGQNPRGRAGAGAGGASALGTAGGGTAGAAGAAGGRGDSGNARGGRTQRGFAGGATGGSGGRGGATGGSGGRGGATGGRSGGADGQAAAAAIPPLDRTQLTLIFQEGTTARPDRPTPARLNINTVPRRLMTEILELDTRTVDAIVKYRDSRPDGFTSVVDLLDVPGIAPEVASTLASTFDTVSAVYSISSKGRSSTTGVEVEIFVVVDRSTLPVRIIEYREQ